MIAIFDSGLGGLSVLREVRRQVPQHDLAYFADSAFCPYGPRPAAWVRERSLAISRWLVEQGAEVLVVACNTASSAALPALREALPIPVVGMEPGLKPAVAQTRSGCVGVLATSGTLDGERFNTLVSRFAGGIEVLTQPCPGWVEQVEAGDLCSTTTRGLVAQYVAPLTKRGADTLVLGCTHYPFLRPLIADVAGIDVTIIDTGPAVARQVARVAAQHAIPPGRAALRYISSGDRATVAATIKRLLDEAVAVEEL